MFNNISNINCINIFKVLLFNLVDMDDTILSQMIASKIELEVIKQNILKIESEPTHIFQWYYGLI